MVFLQLFLYNTNITSEVICLYIPRKDVNTRGSRVDPGHRACTKDSPPKCSILLIRKTSGFRTKQHTCTMTYVYATILGYLVRLRSVTPLQRQSACTFENANSTGVNGFFWYIFISIVLQPQLYTSCYCIHY